MANFKTQQLDVKLTDSVSINVLPATGHILPFAGPSNKIPTGWVLCDGTNGTPDLRGKVPGGITNVSVGGNQTHNHTFTHNLGTFNATTLADSASVSSASIGNNSNNHSHTGTASIYAVTWGDSGPANRSTGTQANVISRNHTHGGTISGAVNFGTGNQNASHSHSYNSYNVDSTTGNSHSHSVSSSPSANTQSANHTSLPSIFYVNFIMKV